MLPYRSLPSAARACAAARHRRSSAPSWGTPRCRAWRWRCSGRLNRRRPARALSSCTSGRTCSLWPLLRTSPRSGVEHARDQRTGRPSPMQCVEGTQTSSHQESRRANSLLPQSCTWKRGSSKRLDEAWTISGEMEQARSNPVSRTMATVSAEKLP